MEIPTEKLKRGSYWATIIAAIIAILVFTVGLIQFSLTQSTQRETLRIQRESLEMDRQSKAVTLFNEYNKLQREISQEQIVSQETEFWYSNFSISLMESLFNLVGDDEGWRATIRWMVLVHKDSITKDGLDCDTFSPSFIEFVKITLKESVCVKE